MMMSRITLRRLLFADAGISGATGLVMLFIRYSGLALIPFAAMVWYFARSPRLSASQVWTVIAMNAAWVVASVLVLVSGAIDPNAWGVAFVLLQALAVAGLAEFQYSALRSRPLIRHA
jgi:hypothetical protein